ncbi:hypothetical protein [Flavobacterium sp. I3-2]|uniref:hypothetical protein n=1 Tax=Flavobacterium sp. I3-2 TaxID=2748319 RepID=UPI0015AFDA83|nr:hypothetical protein [Flavobacterium sp. I3-2]
MGLDMRPMGKPKPGFEKRFKEIYEMINTNFIPKLTFFQKLQGKKQPTREDLLEEWFSIQSSTYETIKAPRVGKDKIADEWILKKYDSLDDKPNLNQFIKDLQGYYVIELAEEQDGVPVYIAWGQDENVFRGEFLNDCEGIISEDLICEAWNSKLADDTLDYGNRLMLATDELAKQYNLEYLKHQKNAPDFEEDSLDCKVHILYSLANWLIFYGKNGHGYEADF